MHVLPSAAAVPVSLRKGLAHLLTQSAPMSCLLYGGACLTCKQQLSLLKQGPCVQAGTSALAWEPHGHRLIIAEAGSDAQVPAWQACFACCCD